MPWDDPGSTAIVVPVPEADTAVAAIYREHAKAGREGMPPHVTLLAPFRHASVIDDEVVRALGRLFAGVREFGFVLPRLSRFDGGVLYLEPHPAEPFLRVIQRLVRSFPDCPPYDAAHADIVPHLTVATGSSEVLAAADERVARCLPISCRAAAATLVERGRDGRWFARTRFPFASLE